jgi:hypothetical protein
LRAKRPGGGNGAREGLMSIMHDAPNVDQPGAITRPQILDGVENGNFGGGDDHAVRLEAPREWVKLTPATGKLSLLSTAARRELR